MLFNFTLISWVFIFMFYCVVGIFIFIPAVLGKNTNKLDTCDKSLMFIFWGGSSSLPNEEPRAPNFLGVFLFY